jgi:hypothetical protein
MPKTLLLFILLFSPLYAKSQAPQFIPHYTYEYNAAVASETWLALEPYFLPFDHPLKSELDHLFGKRKCPLSKAALSAAGFNVHTRTALHIALIQHPRWKKYMIKAYLDEQIAIHEEKRLVERIRGALAIQQCIKKHDFTGFCVPKKWIYPLPQKKGRKNFILIVEKMDLQSPSDNAYAFKHKLSKSKIEALYTILSEEGLIDSVYIDNIPFDRSGRICFIDTEHFHKKPVRYHILKRNLSSQMQAHWQYLIDHPLKVVNSLRS